MPVTDLAVLHQQLIEQFSSYSEEELRNQYHPDISQLGWHLSHIAFIEQYWLREIVLGDDSRTAGLHPYFFPEMIEKSQRGELPNLTDFSRLQESFSDTEDVWISLQYGHSSHPLLKNNYIGWFLLQHGQQHMETMHMALHQKALRHGPVEKPRGQEMTAGDLYPKVPALPRLLFSAGSYPVGSEHVLACDNEQPRHRIDLQAFRLAEKPVSNAEYLGFMHSHGYKHKEIWSRDGWQWLTGSAIEAPEYWRQDEAGSWFELGESGAAAIDPDAAVSGISWYEADAFARYAGCRLPHEHEWEVAMNLDEDLRASCGRAWEWCANVFFPYSGFRAFPYERYSTPWYDSRHYVLKGSSIFSGKTVKQPSFRNFYEADKRHVFAGLRLAADV